MKAARFGLLSVFVLSGFLLSSFLVSAQSSTSWNVSIEKGWNIIPTYGIGNLQSCQPNAAILNNSTFTYNASTKQYMRTVDVLFSETTSTGISSYNPYVDTYTGWFYSPQNCVATYTPTNPIVPGNNNEPTQLTSGWNFFTVMPWMVGHSYSSLFSDCSIQEIYEYKEDAWDGGSVVANSTTSLSGYLDGYNGGNVQDYQVGYSFIIKAAAACQLSQANASTTIPSIPSPPSTAG